MFFKKKKKEINSQEIHKFVDKVVLEYSRIVQKDQVPIRKLSTLPYPKEIVKSCLKIDVVNNINNVPYVSALVMCFSCLSDFMPDEFIPKGNDIITLLEDNISAGTDFKNIIQELDSNKTNNDNYLELLEKIHKEKENLIEEMAEYIKCVESFKNNNPTGDAILSLFNQYKNVNVFLGMCK